MAAVALLVLAPTAAAAAVPHAPLIDAGVLGSIFGSIGHALLGAFSWTIDLASKFILTTVGALVRMLIPRSWANEGLQIMQWIVAVPNYAGTVTSPAGHVVYGFAGINALRDLFTWIGFGLLPLTLVYGTTRAMLGESGPVAVPLVRVLAIAVLLLSYPYWWSQAAALADTLTHTVLTFGPVASGLHKLMLYAVDGVALGGWQLVDLALMALVAIELLALIFMKVAIILLGALLYAIGPLMIGLVPMDSGAAIARAWASAAVALVALPLVWSALFAVGALLIGDAGTAGALIAGQTGIGELFGGVMLAAAGLAALYLCVRAGKEAMGLLRLQLAGLLVLSRRGGASRTAENRPAASSAGSLRRFGARVAQSVSAGAGELALAGTGGAATVRAGRAIGYVGRHGLLGTAAAGAREAATRVAPHAAVLAGRSRAGVVAVRMAKAGTASWQQSGRSTHATPAATPAGKAAAAKVASESTGARRQERTGSSAASPTRPAAESAATGRHAPRTGVSAAGPLAGEGAGAGRGGPRTQPRGRSTRPTPASPAPTTRPATPPGPSPSKRGRGKR